MPVRCMAWCFVNSTNNHGQRSMTSPIFSVLFHGACKARTKLIACLLVTASGYSSLAAADPLLDFRMFKAPEATQRMIREPTVAWLVRPQAELYCRTVEPKDGFFSRPEGCVYWQVKTARCTIVTESPTTHSQLGHLLLHCMAGQ